MKVTPKFSEILKVIQDPASKSLLAMENVTESEPKNIILGPELGVLDASPVIHKRIAEEFKTFKRNDWVWWEFEFERCQGQWLTAEKHEYDKMVKTIAWQWEGDTAAALGMLNIVGNFVTEASTLEYETRIIDNEIVHARTYADMASASFTDPNAIKRELLQTDALKGRLDPITKTLQLLTQVGHEYALGIRKNNLDTYTYGLFYEVITLLLEKVQFNGSFLMTHLLTAGGKWQPISSAVQKIAVDELNFHVPHRMRVIANELQTERGQFAWKQIKPVAQTMFNIVLQTELQWLEEYIFADGKELPGGNLEICKLYTKHCAYEPAKFLGLDTDYDLPEKSPVSSMNKWLDIDARQVSPQDEKGNNYLLMEVVDRGHDINRSAKLSGLLD